MQLAKTWQLQEAKNRLSELVKMSAQAPQSISLRGKPVAVVISMESYNKLIKPRESLVKLLKSAPENLADLELPVINDSSVRNISL